jgi:hypothetical protein
MKVEQAIYGEIRGGHALRLATDFSLLPAELTSRLDLPDTAPPGVEWSPFLSGFPHGNQYVLARTFADPAATRAGMVLSHAVFAPLREATMTADLRPLLGLLITAPLAPERLESRCLTASTEPPPAANELYSAAEALTTRGAGPVVRIGTRGFEDLVAALWFHLWPEIRAGFAFRLSFGPHDLVETLTPSLVSTPTALASRWVAYRIIETAAPNTTSRAAAILSGGAHAEPVLRFAREIGARIDNLRDLPLLERAYELGTASNPKFDECVAVLRLIERLSPESAAGAAGKAKLVEMLSSRLSMATVHDVLLLRNLSMTGLPGADSLWASLETWAATNKFTATDDAGLLSAIDDALLTSEAVETWRRAILNGIAAAARSKSSALTTAFWRWAGARPATLVALTGRLPQDEDFEARLAGAVPPAVSREVGDTIMALALSKRWMCLHGAAAGASLTPREAVRRQLSVDADSGAVDGVKAAMRCATPAQALVIALEVAEPRVLRIAAAAVAHMPTLLKEIDFAFMPAQEVWARVLGLNADAWRGPADPQRSFAVVIQNLLDGGSASAELIDALAATPVADLSGFARRAEVWKRVAEPARANLLRATAAGWLEHASSGEVAYVPDQQLEAVILTGDRLDRVLLALASLGVNSVVQVISALPSYDESRFLRWLDGCSAAPRSMIATDAEALGRLILIRHWRGAVNLLVRLARTRREEVKPALRICSEMVGIFTRWSLGLTSVSEDEKWTALEELAADLYPTGPDCNVLWDRAGGQDADLQNFGNGRVRWHDAIGQIRRGKGLQLDRLLGEMKRDFPFNDQVCYLANKTDFVHGFR